MRKITLLFIILISLSKSNAQSIDWTNNVTWGQVVNSGSTISLDITYDVGSGNDMNYIHVVLSRYNTSSFAILEDYGNGGLFPVTEDDANSGSITVSLDLDTSAPLDTDLAAGEGLMIRVYMEYDLAGGGVGYQNDNQDITYEAATASNKDFKKESNLILYPNPVKNTIFLKGQDLPIEFKIINALGKTINQGVFDDNIDVSGLRNGLYFLIYDNKTFQRFIKK